MNLSRKIVKTKPRLLFYLLILVVLSGCAGQAQIVKQIPSVEDHNHKHTNIRSFGDMHYHASMKYDALLGEIKIEFLDMVFLL